MPAYVSTPPVAMPYAPPVPQPPPSVPIPSSSTIADILARNSAALTTSSVTPSLPLPAPVQPPQIAPPSAAQTNGNTSSLLASLRAAGLLPSSTSTPTSASAPPGATQAHQLPPTNSVQQSLANPIGSPGKAGLNGVELTTASLKMYSLNLDKRAMLITIRPRPRLVSKLYEARPNQCSTCGKRFLLTDEDRKKKASHLDWHFRTNQRLNDTMQRGQSRSWYVDELVSTFSINVQPPKAC